MTEISMEYTKRTCLICGCHTSQTINIYEPRSGPNIVELIQAKFKFQPLDDDKYLCYSCNNWLINWHSLQALNIHESDNDSMIFQSHLNNALPNDKVNPKETTYRPIAVCKPINIKRLPSKNISNTELNIPYNSMKNTISNMHANTIGNVNANGSGNVNSISENCINKKKLPIKLVKLKRFNRIHCVCGRTISRQLKPKKYFIARRLRKKTRHALVKCQSEQVILSQEKQPLKQYSKQFQNSNFMKAADKKIEIDTVNQSNKQSQTVIMSAKEYLKEPLLDGRMIAMLRRIGTTLSQEEKETAVTTQSNVKESENGNGNGSDSENKSSNSGKGSSGNSSSGRGSSGRGSSGRGSSGRGSSGSNSGSGSDSGSDNDNENDITGMKRLPKIMSPIKKKHNWSRPLNDDEIPLNFDANISEVLPIVMATTVAKKTLDYTTNCKSNAKCNSLDPNHNLCGINNLENNDEIPDNMFKYTLVNNDVNDNTDGIMDAAVDHVNEINVKGTVKNVENLVNFRLPKGLSITLV